MGLDVEEPMSARKRKRCRRWEGTAAEVELAEFGSSAGLAIFDVPHGMVCC